MLEHEDVENIVNESQQKQALYCEEHFIPRNMAMRGVWAVLILGLGLLGTGWGWALNESNIQSKQEVRLDQHDKDIESLQSIHKTMDTVVTLVKQIRSSQK